MNIIRNGIFDFNGDGKISGFERAAEVAFIHHIFEESEEPAEETDRSFSAFHSASSSAFDDEELDPDEQESRSMDLVIAGLDEIELSFMDEDERRAAIEAVGLDPDDYDYIC